MKNKLFPVPGLFISSLWRTAAANAGSSFLFKQTTLRLSLSFQSPTDFSTLLLFATKKIKSYVQLNATFEKIIKEQFVHLQRKMNLGDFPEDSCGNKIQVILVLYFDRP